MAGAGRHQQGPIFRAIDRWEAIEERALTPQSINLIVKRRCALAGLEAREFSAHGLRSGYLTEAAQRGVSLPEADAAVAASIGAAGGQLLQRSRSTTRSSCTARGLNRHSGPRPNVNSASLAARWKGVDWTSIGRRFGPFPRELTAVNFLLVGVISLACGSVTSGCTSGCWR